MPGFCAARRASCREVPTGTARPALPATPQGGPLQRGWRRRGRSPGSGRARFRDAAGRVILTRWREMMSYRDGTLLGEDIEELHAMRVSSRRLRAAMDAFEGAFPRASRSGPCCAR